MGQPEEQHPAQVCDVNGAELLGTDETAPESIRDLDAFAQNLADCFPGYADFSVLYLSNQVYVLRATDVLRNLPVVLKACLDVNFASAATKLRHEWNCQSILGEIDGIKIPRSLESCNDNKGIMLVFANIGDLPASVHFEREISYIGFCNLPAEPNLGPCNMNLGLFLTWAIDTAIILTALHDRGITHGNINTVSTGVDGDGKAMIFDLSCCTFLEREEAQHNEISARQLPFMSPESSGRINRSVDFRSDFYSLGVCFYFLLTGRCPFTSTNALDLIYQHIAHTPLAPHEICPDLPHCLSAIVLKLMAKTAEDRYQTGQGLIADLTMLKEFDTFHNLREFTNFVPGQADAASQFSIPQTLFGREEEIGDLLACFEQVKQNGGGNVAIVKGGSGTGKSSLVNEIHRPVLESRSFYASGKFDQYKRGVPFFCLLQAAGELVRQLVSQSDLKLDEWKEEILLALDKEAAALFDVLPEVRNLFGNAMQLSVLPEIGPNEREQRFTDVFLRFILCFAKRGSPLVLFLDDIQWSSIAEMNLIANLAIASSQATTHSLMLVIAYRDNEVSEGHHVLGMLHKLAEASVAVKVIEIKSMRLEAVRDMIAATLRCQSNRRNVELETLTKLICANTEGNAFFITQVLRRLKDRDQLYYDFSEKRWKFDLTSILQEDLPVTVIDLLVAQIQQLGSRTRNCLQMAACLGNNRFSLRLLAVVSHQTMSATGRDLWAALQTGLLIPTSSTYKTSAAHALEETNGGDDAMNLDVSTNGSSWGLEADNTEDATFRFLHDRVQQAAYQLIAEEQRPQYHLMLGFRLLDYYTEEGLMDTFVFEIVNQINHGLKFLTPDKLAGVIDLNLIAGKKALRSTAFEAALQYLATAKALTPASWWEEQFELTLDIHLNHVDAQYASQNYPSAVDSLVSIAQRARNSFERAQIMSRMVDVYMALDDFHSAIDVGFQAMEQLGVVMPRTVEEAAILAHDHKAKLDLSIDQIDAIGSSTISTDAETVLLQSIASAVLLPIYLCRPEILQAVAGALILLILERGVSEAGAYHLVIYGLTLLSGERSAKARQQGYHMGVAAVKLVNAASAQVLTPTAPKVFKVFASHICYWNEPPRACLVYFNSAMATGNLVFNVEYTCSAYVESCAYAFYSGEPLTSVVPRMTSYLPMIRKYKLATQNWYCAIQLQCWTNLMSESNDPAELEGEFFSQSKEFDALIAADSHPQIFVFFMAKLLVAIYFHRPRDVIFSLLNEMDRYALGTQGTVYVGRYSFLICSALIHNFSSLSAEHVAMFYEHYATLQYYRDGAPASFEHQVQFTEAEVLRHDGRDLDALEKFETAYASAQTTGNIHEAGHIAERTYLWLALKNKSLAQKYLLKAYTCFKVSGFRAKVAELKCRYPDLLVDSITRKYTKDDMQPFRSVNMQMMRDGTLAKSTVAVVASPQMVTMRDHDEDDQISVAGKTDVTAQSRMSATLHLKDLPPQPSSHPSNDTSVIEDDLTPTGTLSSFLSKSKSANLRPSLQNARMSHDSSSSGSVQHAKTSAYTETKDLDLEVALKASVMIADVLQVTEVLRRLIESVLMNAGADYGALLLIEKGDLFIEATGRNDAIDIVSHQLLGTHSNLVPASLINYVARLRETTVLGSGQEYRSFQTRFGKDPYFQDKRLRSIMCMPVQNSVNLIGVLYLENSKTAYTFGPRRVSLLNFLCTQAAIAIEKARLYHDLGIAKDEAQASNKMKSEFLSTISHEIRTPFNAVLGMSGFLLDTKLSPMQVDYVETIRNSSKELLRVIDDILDFSKMEHGTFELHKEDFSLRSCIEGALQITAERAATKELELAYFNCHGDVPDILINDTGRFRQIVINLVGNSIKFTEKGSVTVSSHATLLRPASPTQPATYRIQVSVRDTGIGIKEEDRGKLFKLFSQIDSSLARNFSGTGLGLAISEKLVRLMGGQIWVESKAGIGSTFHFTVVTDAKAHEQIPHPLSVKVRGLGVLILDDSEVATRALSESLEWLGMRVLVTKNVKDMAHAISANPAGAFRIALIDLHYGLADEVVSKLAQYDPACKIIRLSRFGFRQEFDDKYEYLIKPVKRERLVKVVAETLFPGSMKLDTTVEGENGAFNPVGMATKHPLRILLAEDNLINSRVALQHLKRLGYSAVHAKDGQYCLEDEEKAIYDVILMDVQMPRVDGCQAAARLRAKYAHDPERCPRIIAMTANAMRGDMERCLEAGMHAYCQKPIIADVLAQRLRESTRRSE